MKKHAIISILAVTTIVFIAYCDTRAKGPSEKAKSRIRLLANKKPILMDMFIPEMDSKEQVSLDSLSPSITSNTLNWINGVVRQQYLPSNIEKKIYAWNDVKIWEKRDKNGVIFSELIGDYITLQYELDGDAFYIQENGVSISIRINFREPHSTIIHPYHYMHEMLTKYFSIPIESIRDLSVGYYPPLYKASIADVDPKQKVWWQSVQAYADESFMFVTIKELVPGGSKLNPRPGLPDRF